MSLQATISRDTLNDVMMILDMQYREHMCFAKLGDKGGTSAIRPSYNTHSH